VLVLIQDNHGFGYESPGSHGLLAVLAANRRHRSRAPSDSGGSHLLLFLVPPALGYLFALRVL
jgi:hypothetical protein